MNPAQVCPRCGSGVMDTGVCGSCGYNLLVELEIGAFMGPHIKRARIVLFTVGVLYLVTGGMAYSELRQLMELVDRHAVSTEVRDTLTLIHVAVGFVMAGGAANVVLAWLAGKRTMLAFHAAAGIFIAHTLLQAYVTSGVVFTGLLWWLTAITLSMGYVAARKAEQLRASAR